MSAFSRVNPNINDGGDSMEIDTQSQTPQMSSPRYIFSQGRNNTNKNDNDNTFLSIGRTLCPSTDKKDEDSLGLRINAAPSAYNHHSNSNNNVSNKTSTRTISPDHVMDMDINNEKWDPKEVAKEMLTNITPVIHRALSNAGVPDNFHQSCTAELLQMMAQLTTDNSSSMMDTFGRLHNQNVSKKRSRSEITDESSSNLSDNDVIDDMLMGGEVDGFDSGMTDQSVLQGGFTSQSQETVNEKDSVDVLAAPTHISGNDTKLMEEEDCKDVLDMSLESKRKELMPTTEYGKEDSLDVLDTSLESKGKKPIPTAEKGKDKMMYCNLYINTRPPHSVSFIYTTL